ncbi:MAG: helix-turn-helix domain-containing protein [Synergistaceae bacterium]|nr:helix-turn-helix domain-containing protein [Synergistaceae bacterium]
MSDKIKVTRVLPYFMMDSVVMTDPTLSPIDKAVFGVLCVHAGLESRQCFLKVKTIANEASCSERSAQNSLKTLEERGIIERTERFKEGSQVSSSYQIIGREAPCYTEIGCNDFTPPRTECTRGVQETTPRINEKSLNDTKDSLTREAELPTSEELPIPPIPESPTESFSPEDVPEIMRSTAEYLLLKTGRKTLTEPEISALRELSAHQYPSRVQKEIDRACERFRRKGNSLETLTFSYIAGALRNQPTLKKKSSTKSKPDGMSLTQAEIDATRPEQTEEELDRELEQLRAEMIEEGC